jgi:hypothetical protein
MVVVVAGPKPNRDERGRILAATHPSSLILLLLLEEEEYVARLCCNKVRSHCFKIDGAKLFILDVSGQQHHQRYSVESIG